MMGQDVMIFGMDHESSRTDIAMIDQGFKPEKQVTVGDDVFIGARVIILPASRLVLGR
jgi:maltose O-acetyltransferase